MRRPDVYKFRHVAVFGIPDSKEDPLTGITSSDRSTFKPIKRKHYARKKQTLSDRYQAIGTRYQDVTIILIRHDVELARQEVLQVNLAGDLYDVISYSPDDDGFESLDMLTLSKVKKV